jgi:hypothetical protein
MVAVPEEDEFFCKNFLLILTALYFLGWGAAGGMDRRVGADWFVGEIKGFELELYAASEVATDCSSEAVDVSPLGLNTQTGSSPP